MLCHVHDLGLMDYQPAWDLQNRLAAEIARSERPPTLLLLEHPHTYTFGRRGQAENLLWDENQLKARGVSVHWVDRGGDVTYHGPGQLVGYPLVPLGQIGLKVSRLWSCKVGRFCTPAPLITLAMCGIWRKCSSWRWGGWGWHPAS